MKESIDLNLTPPLRELRWNGHTLEAHVDGSIDLELCLDGVRFIAWPRREDGRYAQIFAYAPGGDTRLCFEVRHSGLPLHAPVQAEWGRAGLRVAPPASSTLDAIDPMVEERLDLAAARSRAALKPVDIIVPVYNAPAAVARCLAALRQYTLDSARLLLIDDASTDPAVAPLLAVAAAWPNVRVERNRKNRGFTATVNAGLDQVGDGDVVLLNADTEVGPDWLGALRRAAYARAETGSATAVSDNAGAFSVPELEQDNPLPRGWSAADAARALLHDAGLVLPRLPTGNGFCMYLRHDARRLVGKLDAKAFPQGYGEENDWSQRAERHGFRHVIAGNVFVAHARSMSFGEERRRELGLAGMQVLRKRYPGYEAAVGAQLFSWQRLVLNWRVRRLWAMAGSAPRARVLLGDGASAMAWSGWEVWRLRHHHKVIRLLDADGSEQGSAEVDALPAALTAWLQRHGFEAVTTAGVVGEVAGLLGFACAERPADIRYAFRAAI
ncbi:MAG TPA: glycosyltransferase [Rhodanobacteraceae bacterium]|nr:glycosyltransferase [Rhodanobacteraceae bacterium]